MLIRESVKFNSVFVMDVLPFKLYTYCAGLSKLMNDKIHHFIFCLWIELKLSFLFRSPLLSSPCSGWAFLILSLKLLWLYIVRRVFVGRTRMLFRVSMSRIKASVKAAPFPRTYLILCSLVFSTTLRKRMNNNMAC